MQSQKRTIYACNLFQMGPNMLEIIEIVFWRYSIRNHSHVTLGSFSTLQAYLAPFVFIIASIFSPFFSKIASILGLNRNLHCKHIWSCHENHMLHMICSPALYRIYIHVILAIILWNIFNIRSSLVFGPLSAMHC